MNTLTIILALTGLLLALASVNMAYEMLSERSERLRNATQNIRRARAYEAVRERRNKSQNRQMLWRTLEK